MCHSIPVFQEYSGAVRKLCVPGLGAEYWLGVGLVPRHPHSHHYAHTVPAHRRELHGELFNRFICTNIITLTLTMLDWVLEKIKIYLLCFIYCQTSNISCTLGNKIAEPSDVV